MYFKKHINLIDCIKKSSQTKFRNQKRKKEKEKNRPLSTIAATAKWYKKKQKQWRLSRTKKQKTKNKNKNKKWRYNPSHRIECISKALCRIPNITLRSASFVHVRRASNAVAHVLAREAMLKNLNVCWRSDFPLLYSRSYC
jgi:hypothetical protein